MKKHISTVLTGSDIDRLEDILKYHSSKENPITPSALIRFLIREEARLIFIHRRRGNQINPPLFQ